MNSNALNRRNFLAGATFNSRKVGFQSAFLELAPAAERDTYKGLNAMLILPVAFLSLAAGIFLEYWSYLALFGFWRYSLAQKLFSPGDRLPNFAPKYAQAAILPKKSPPGWFTQTVMLKGVICGKFSSK